MITFTRRTIVPVVLRRGSAAYVLPGKDGSNGPDTPTAARASDHQKGVWWYYLFKLFIAGGGLLLIVFAGPPLQAHAASHTPRKSASYRVLGPPTVSAAFLNRVLASYHSPAAGTGWALYEDGVAYGIDPVFALAFFFEESSFGRTGVARVTLSLGNIRCTPGYPVCYYGYRAYASWQAGYVDWYALIRGLYVNRWGLTTVNQIVPVYAPANENNVSAYIATVKYAVRAWRAGQVIV
jgi:hypothetical protein